MPRRGDSQWAANPAVPSHWLKLAIQFSFITSSTLAVARNHFYLAFDRIPHAAKVLWGCITFEIALVEQTIKMSNPFELIGHTNVSVDRYNGIPLDRSVLSLSAGLRG